MCDDRVGKTKMRVYFGINTLIVKGRKKQTHSRRGLKTCRVVVTGAVLSLVLSVIVFRSSLSFGSQAASSAQGRTRHTDTVTNLITINHKSSACLRAFDHAATAQ